MSTDQLTLDDELRYDRYRHALIVYRLAGSRATVGHLRPYEDDQARRWETDRIELGDWSAAWSNEGASSFVVDWTYRRYPAPARYPMKQIGLPTLRNSYMLSLFRWIRETESKGGETDMASSLVKQIVADAKVAKENYDQAVEERANVRKAARALLEAGYLEDDDAALIEEMFPKRERNTGETSE